MDKDTAIRILVANIKIDGKRTIKYSDDLLTIAEAFKVLVKANKGSITKTAKELGFVSDTHISKFLNLLKLEKRVKKFIKARLLGFTKSYQISLLPKQKQFWYAQRIIEHKLNTNDVEKLIDHALTYPDKSVGQCLRDLEKWRPKEKEVHLLLIELNHDVMETLTDVSQRWNLDPKEMVKFLFKQKASAKLDSVKINDSFLSITTDREGYDSIIKAVTNKSKLEDVISRWIIEMEKENEKSWKK